MAKINRIAVLGLGKVGTLVASLLQHSGFEVTGVDAVARKKLSFKTQKADVTKKADLKKLFKNQDAVVSCLPYNLNLSVAKTAHDMGVHYFDLTEDVPTTQAIIKMSKTSSTVMAPQCGLAPGFIGIVGAALAGGFSKIRNIRLRVGALPQHPTGILGYAFNWSPQGVINEYLNDCEVIQDKKHKWISPLSRLETIYIDGIKLEAFTTSGGLGTMCETYKGKVEQLNYKTMRYPGHVRAIKFLLDELLLREDPELSANILINAKPPVNDDVVYVHASVEGWKKDRLLRDEFVRAYRPQEIEGQMWRAISWTTAASICAVVEMVSDGALPAKGFIKQEDIPLESFLKTRNGSYYNETGLDVNEREVA